MFPFLSASFPPFFALSLPRVSRRLTDTSHSHVQLEAQFDDPSVAIGGNEEVIRTMLALLARDGLAPN